jgi:hypothetical protein
MPKNPTSRRRNQQFATLASELRRLQRRVETLEDLLDLRAAVDRNAGKPGVPWDAAKAHLDLE